MSSRWDENKDQNSECSNNKRWCHYVNSQPVDRIWDTRVHCLCRQRMSLCFYVRQMAPLALTKNPTLNCETIIIKSPSSSPLLIRMWTSYKIAGNVNHARVFNFENCVATDECNSTTFRNQHHIISLKKPHKPYQHDNICPHLHCSIVTCQVCLNIQQMHHFICFITENQTQQFVPMTPVSSSKPYQDNFLPTFVQ